MSILYNDALNEHGVFHRNLSEDLRLCAGTASGEPFSADCAGFRNASGALSFGSVRRT
jgi:hypothetical protein